MKVRKMPYWTDGQHKLSEKWYAVFVDYSETSRLPLFEDRRASDSLAKVIDRLNSIHAGSDVMTPDLGRSRGGDAANSGAKLAKWGILSAAKVAAGNPLAVHLDDWKSSLLAKGSTQNHAEKTARRAPKCLRNAGFNSGRTCRRASYRRLLAACGRISQRRWGDRAWNLVPNVKFLPSSGKTIRAVDGSRWPRGGVTIGSLTPA